MFAKSRRWIVAAIMAVLVILLAGTLAIIYGLSFSEVYTRNEDLLQSYMERYRIWDVDRTRATTSDSADSNAADDLGNGLDDTDSLGSNAFGSSTNDSASADSIDANTDADTTSGFPAVALPTERFRGDRGFPDDGQLAGAVFYSVAFSYSGEALVVENGATDSYTDDELIEKARALLEEGVSQGIDGNLIYRIGDKGFYVLVAFMDNTLMQESASSLFRYTLIFGVVAIVIIFFISWYLARLIVRPLEDAYVKQRQFISDAGHELKTPIAVVSTNAELLSRELGQNPWLANIQYENERMSTLVTQLLDLARTENNKPVFSRVDLSRIVTGEGLLFESVAYEKGMQLETEIAEGLQVDGNDMQLKQLISILLDNALSYGENDMPVKLILRRDKRSAVLSVIDGGEPIPPDIAANLFERFYRSDQARTGDSGHYGLGLSIAKAIVDAHGGKISVKCYDHKVDFTVRLPLASNA